MSFKLKIFRICVQKKDSDHFSNEQVNRAYYDSFKMLK